MHWHLEGDADLTVADLAEDRAELLLLARDYMNEAGVPDDAEAARVFAEAFADTVELAAARAFRVAA
ncbi:MAG: hypothetical protein AAF447_17310 [Myxococcota bacterium]